MRTMPEAQRPLPYGADQDPEKAARRRTPQQWSPKRILVASRGSRTSDGALRVAAELAGRTGAAVELVTVWQPDVLPPVEPTIRHPCECTDRRRVAEVLRRTRSQRHAVLGASPRLPMQLAIGYPPLAIAREAVAWGADLIVIGLGHPDPEERVRGDETALRLAYATDVPILAVPASAREAGEPMVLPLHGCTFEERAVANETVARVMRTTESAVLLVPPEGTHVVERVGPIHPVLACGLTPAGIYQPGAVARW